MADADALRPVICFGEILLRLAAPGRERLFQSGRLDASFGGAEANVAAALAGFGSASALVTDLPDTPVGRAAAAAMRSFGVGEGDVRFGPGRMGVYFLEQGAGLRPSELAYDREGSTFALAAPGRDWPSLVAGASRLHVSGVTLALGDGPAGALEAAVSAARSLRVPVSFDGNFRPSLWRGREAEAPARLRSVLSCADLAFVDHRDLELALRIGPSDAPLDLRRRRAVEAAFAAFPELGRIAFTIRGAEDLGARLWTREAAFEAGPLSLRGAIDRIGAGDAFAAGLVHGLVRGWPEPDALTFALAAGALKHFVTGDVLVATEAEVKRIAGGDVGGIRR